MKVYPPVEEQDAKQLHRRLVEDAVARKATPLKWAVLAYERIGRLERCGAEEAYHRVRTELEELTGSAAMPMT